MKAGAAVVALFAAAQPSAAAVVPIEVPQIDDARLQLTLYADAPDIVTPIGAAVDARGRLFVLESHTHVAPRNYRGPKRDRVILFEGAGPDGRAARRHVFADDILEGMNLAFAPDGTLHVITAKTVAALPDRDGDDRADETRVILRLETEQKYPHNQLLGLTISADGWVYATRGNTAGDPHAWVAADGARLEAYGNGGDIVRCRLDGTRLQRVATGFWNPFDLKFDRHGRLLCVDNDPDSRGPNRLLHIVTGGDYGFRAHYGGSGLHPYNAWDGELPGTLPMVAGIGEAPSAVLDLSFGALPPEYRDAIVATIWGEHNVSIVRPNPAGVSLRGTAAPFIRGGKWFRPVAMVAAPDGTIYLTDWVLKDYPNHGQGRIWKLTARPGVAVMQPAKPGTNVDSYAAQVRRLGETNAWRALLRDRDPFLRHAATVEFARPAHRTDVFAALENNDPDLRLAALLALRRAEIGEPEKWIRPRLRDSSEPVRLLALIWTGEEELRALRPEINAAVATADVSPRLFDTWLATRQILDTPPPAAGARRPGGFRIRRETDARVLDAVVADEALPSALRAMALRRLAGRSGVVTTERLATLARTAPVELRIEAIRTLATLGDTASRETFSALAGQSTQPARVRAEAIVALGAGESATLTPLLADPDETVRRQAARTLRRESPGTSPAPAAAAEWTRRLASGGDAEAGERVFFAPTSTCAQCHRIGGRGGTLGPDLSLLARTSTREQIVRAIVSPSEEIAPQFQGWEVKTKAGEVLTGLQGHWRAGGAASLVLLDGRERTVAANQVDSFRALETSLMPEGIASLFAVEELRDLVAFLERLK